jgi:hypothetical protein
LLSLIRFPQSKERHTFRRISATRLVCDRLK